MIKNKKKAIINFIFLAVLFLLTIYSVFHDQNMGEFINAIKGADIKYWLIAVFCVIVFISGESVIIFYMMESLQHKISFFHCLLYSFVGFFFSCITPASAGGQPAQLYYMSKDKVPIPMATLVLMIVTITYKLVLVVIGAAVFLIHPPSIMSFLNPVLFWCYLGLFLNSIGVCFMLLLVFHPTLVRKILETILQLISKVRVLKRKDFYLEKLNKSMQQYQDVSSFFSTHKFVIWNVFLITFVQRLLLFFVTYLAFRSLGLNQIGLMTIVILQAMISVAVEMLPLPGGMGMSERLFLLIFTPICGSITLPAMMVSRGLSYYTQLIISGLLTVFAHFIIGKKEGKE